MPYTNKCVSCLTWGLHHSHRQDVVKLKKKKLFHWFPEPTDCMFSCRSLPIVLIIWPAFLHIMFFSWMKKCQVYFGSCVGRNKWLLHFFFFFLSGDTNLVTGLSNRRKKSRLTPVSWVSAQNAHNETFDTKDFLLNFTSSEAGKKEGRAGLHESNSTKNIFLKC